MTVDLVFERVQASDSAGPTGRPLGSLAELTLALGPGVHAVHGTPRDGTLALFDVASGARSPRRGSVTVAGRAPARFAAIRARIGTLGSEPNLPEARTVAATVALALEARGEDPTATMGILEALDLASLAARRLRSLTFAEERAVELALALSTTTPRLLVLYEPLTEVLIPRPARVVEKIRAIGASGVCVLVLTSSRSDAHLLSEHVLVLERGLLREPLDQACGPRGTFSLTAWVSGEAREFVASLSRNPEVEALRWENAPDEGKTIVSVWVRGHSLERLALALTDSAVASGTTLHAITPGSMPLIAPLPQPAPKTAASPPPSESPPRPEPDETSNVPTPQTAAVAEPEVVG